MKKCTVMLAAAFVAGTTMLSAQAAEEKKWKGEITPYLWAAGIEGDVTVGGQTVQADVGFSDLVDAVDIAGSVLGVFQYEKIVFWLQLDYFSLTTDQLDNPPAAGSLDSDMTMSTLAVGYQFDGWKPGQTFDVLVGVRNLSMDNTLKLNGIGTFESNKEFTDTVLVVRPSLPLSANWRFNPTLSYGSGDSESTWELQPQFQYQISEHWAARMGYRRLYYNIKNDAGNEWDGVFHGFIVGLGGTF